MLRRLQLVAGWLAATAVAAALGWAAVGAVTAPVTEPPPLPDVSAAPAATATASSRTTELVGGSVGVRNTGGAVELLFATPRAGFGVEVREAGPARIDVRFSSSEHESRFRVGAGAAEEVEERPR